MGSEGADLPHPNVRPGGGEDKQDRTTQRARRLTILDVRRSNSAHKGDRDRSLREEMTSARQRGLGR